ncbi:MAG TPA: 2-oxoglutarate dehydrogenase E1 component [Anaerolineaceae bacterium]|nr:2-oxoglutarate dehydrogenase E1 component [Anaerolineaceae bacterium]
MNLFDEFHGPNAAYLIDSFDRFRQDPDSVDPETRRFFQQLDPAQVELLTRAGPPPEIRAPHPLAEPESAALDPAKVVGVTNLAQAIRWYGHLAARLDPLGSPPPGDPALDLETYGLTETDLNQLPPRLVGGVVGEAVERQGGAAADAIRSLREIYSGRIGFDYLQNRDPEERTWLREAAESRRFSPEKDPLDPVGLLERLTQVETFEHFLHRTFVAKTRFSIEGLDMLIPMMDAIIDCAVDTGIYNVLLGMAHRGRLNVLAHILHKPIEQILAEFKDPLRRQHPQNDSMGFSGDVKYHAGAAMVIDEDNDPETVNVTIVLAPNPSHLEAVNPVVEGMARAAGTLTVEPGPGSFNPSITLPVLIHGDAAFPGEGVVSETLNLYRLNGYATGGTIHIIANNQIGFTTNPNDGRSTLFASDLAKGFRIPILHVNADDPEACITAARTAFAYRARFHRDFVINLIGYRRHGHNEGDEPAFTQPRLYKTIESHPTARQIWAERLVEQDVIPADLPDRLYRQRIDELQAVLDRLDPQALAEPIPEPAPPGAARKVHTAVSLERLARLNQALTHLPPGFTLHPRLARIRQRRPRIETDGGEAGTVKIDWSAAEDLALASILEDGIPIRLTGQDAERGTFSHRHAVLYDVESGERYVPLNALPEARAAFEIYNSPLSEYAALGFEFGYNVQASDRLVIWEAQYGDFINNAQTIVDEFLVSARDKWGQLPSLVLLLPHGNEGQGPDHSSGRVERFLSLTADLNLRVANCTTAANYFHLLRRQAGLLQVDPLPLVVLTPKSLLRHPLVASPLRDFTSGGWQPAIDRQPLDDQPAAELPPVELVRRVLLCSGKVAIDLLTSELAAQHPETAVVRVEQLAPFPVDDLLDTLAGYPALEELVWVQEEPENMGAWSYARPHLEGIAATLNRTAPLYRVARPRSANPAEGSATLYHENQQRLIERAFGPLDEHAAPSGHAGNFAGAGAGRKAGKRSAREGRTNGD